MEITRILRKGRSKDQRNPVLLDIQGQEGCWAQPALQGSQEGRRFSEMEGSDTWMRAGWREGEARRIYWVCVVCVVWCL